MTEISTENEKLPKMLISLILFTDSICQHICKMKKIKIVSRCIGVTNLFVLGLHMAVSLVFYRAGETNKFTFSTANDNDKHIRSYGELEETGVN